MAKYVDIARELSDRIMNSTYPADSYLPSESELQEEFQASRDTIRKALNLLADRKRIVKEKGKGSRILPTEMVTFPTSGLTSFKELASLSNQNIQTDVIRFEATNNPKILKNLNLDPHEKAIYIQRVRSYDGQRVILDENYINPQIIPGLTKEIAADSLYEYIEKVLEKPVGFARKEITVEPATSAQKKLLDMNGNDLLVVVRSFTYLENGTLFDYSESRHRPDKFKFLDFSRRESL